jgi:hypothetical protein
MCSATCTLYQIPRVVLGENESYMGGEAFLKERGVEVTSAVCDMTIYSDNRNSGHQFDVT